MPKFYNNQHFVKIKTAADYSKKPQKFCYYANHHGFEKVYHQQNHKCMSQTVSQGFAASIVAASHQACPANKRWHEKLPRLMAN